MVEPENPDEDAEQDETGKQLDEDAKRAITYQIKKNRGLTPHKKKELRNPRVKHRMKFRKAVIRRKGQVRYFHFFFFGLNI
jgi:U3 small nucleolar RNA-associated protein 3